MNKFSKILVLVFVFLLSLTVCIACNKGSGSGGNSIDSKTESKSSCNAGESDFESDFSSGIVNDSENLSESKVESESENETTSERDSESESDIPYSDGLEYKLNSDGNSYTVTDVGTFTGTKLNIPNEYNGKPVTNIGEYAFYGCSELTSVTISNRIISVGKSAFYACYKITNIYITDLTSWCKISGIKNLMMYGSENKKMYVNGILITDLSIPNGVTDIEEMAFYNCDGLISIEIPDSVTNIWNYAFANCIGIMSITIGKGVTNIEDWAFMNCYKLVEVINNSELNIAKGEDSFGGVAYYALNVKKGGATDIVNVDDYLFFTSNGFNGGNIIYLSDVNHLLGYVGKNKELVLPNNYNGQEYRIYDYAFYNHKGLKNVLMGDGVVSIGNYAFSGCSELTSVETGNVATSIGSRAFENCNKLVSVSIGNGVTSIYRGAFENCRSLKRVSIPDSVISIEYEAFSNCSNLASVIIGTGVRSIENNVFSNCSGIESLEVSGNNAKYHSKGNCLIETASKTLVLGCKNSVIPNDGSIISIGSGAFEYCGDLTSIVIPDSITYIENYAFYHCDKLTSITIPRAIISIGDFAFAGCGGLTSVVWNAESCRWAGRHSSYPSGTGSYHYSIFKDCSKLTNITIGENVKALPSYVFFECGGLSSIEFKGTKEQWNAISKASGWDSKTGNYTIHCTDGDIEKT